jgi:hypothetical protein
LVSFCHLAVLLSCGEDNKLVLKFCERKNHTVVDDTCTSG